MKKLFWILMAFLILATNNLYSMASTKSIQYTTEDNFNMTGNLYLPKLPKGQKAPLVVLLHSIGTNKRMWGDLPELLASKGYACLALDLRGHGQSIYNSRLKERSWMYFTDKDYAKYPKDVIYSIEAMKTQFGKKINTNKMIFIGSNIGANTAVLAAAKINKKGYFVKSIVMISPRLKIKNLFIPIEMVNYGAHPILIFDNKNIPKGFNETLEIKKYAQGECVLKAFNGGGMGAALYKSTPSVKTDTINWVTKIFSSPCP